MLESWNTEITSMQSLALGGSQSSGGDRLDRLVVKLIVIRALNLRSQECVEGQGQAGEEAGRLGLLCREGVS